MGNYSAATNNNEVGTLAVDGWVGCYIWYSKEGTGRGRSPARPLLAVPNVTVHLSTASVPITVLLYNGPLLGGFNVPIKGLTWQQITSPWQWTVISLNHCNYRYTKWPVCYIWYNEAGLRRARRPSFAVSINDPVNKASVTIIHQLMTQLTRPV